METNTMTPTESSNAEVNDCTNCEKSTQLTSARIMADCVKFQTDNAATLAPPANYIAPAKVTDTVAITAPGDYIARNGQRVRIHEISDPKTCTYNCKGRVKKVKGKDWIFTTWEANGKHCGTREDFFGPHHHDIVAVA